MSSFYSNAAEREEDFPQYAFIEPNYMKGEQNDDHPAHATMRAQRLIAKVYNALRSNERLWQSTLLVVLYDEHGGFYDHVVPPACVPPDRHQEQFTFDQLGVRVPAILVSPWVDAGVVNVEFDHTSLLKYLAEKWHLGSLTERDAQANSIAAVIRRHGTPRRDTPKTLPIPPMAQQMRGADLPIGAAEDAVPEELEAPDNDLQRSLMVFAEHLEIDETKRSRAPMRMEMGSPLAEGELAKRRVAGFLQQMAEEGI